MHFFQETGVWHYEAASRKLSDLLETFLEELNTLRFKDVKFAYPFRPDVQVPLVHALVCMCGSYNRNHKNRLVVQHFGKSVTIHVIMSR